MPVARAEALATYIKNWVQTKDSNIKVVGPMQRTIPKNTGVLQLTSIEWLTDASEGPDLLVTVEIKFSENNSNDFGPGFDFSLIPNGTDFTIQSLVGNASITDGETKQRETTWTSIWEVRDRE